MAIKFAAERHCGHDICAENICDYGCIPGCSFSRIFGVKENFIPINRPEPKNYYLHHYP